MLGVIAEKSYKYIKAVKGSKEEVKHLVDQMIDV